MLKQLAALALLCMPLPALAQDNDLPPPQDYLLEALQLLQTHHYRSSGAHWDVLRAEAAEVFETDGSDIPAAHGAIRHVITALGERHSFLRTDTIAPAESAAATLPDADNAPSENAASQPPVPRWTRVNGGIGYITLPGLDTSRGDFALAERYTAALIEGLTQMDEEASCGWIVDLRGNTGGNMWPMLAGLDPLLGQAPFGFFDFGTRRTAWARSANGITAVRDVDASIAPAFNLRNADKPLAVVLSGRTSSSGEMTALALIGREGVRSFGQPTGGYSTANSTFNLPDGALLVITVSNAADRTGQVADGSLIPDNEYSNLEANFAARDWLLEECVAAG